MNRRPNSKRTPAQSKRDSIISFLMAIMSLALVVKFSADGTLFDSYRTSTWIPISLMCVYMGFDMLQEYRRATRGDGDNSSSDDRIRVRKRATVATAIMAIAAVIVGVMDLAIGRISGLDTFFLVIFLISSPVACWLFLNRNNGE